MPENTDETQGLLQDIKSFMIAQQVAGHTRGTLEFYRQKLRKFTNFAQKRGVKDTKSITADLIRAYILELQPNHRPAGVQAFYRSLRAFLYWWEIENEPEDYRNPIRKVKSPKIPDEPIPGATYEDVVKLFESCGSDFFGIRDKSIFLTLFDTGLRASELCNLTLDDLNLAESSLLCKQGKGRKPRVVFLGQRARRFLRAWLRVRGTGGEALYTTGTGEKITYWGLREILRRHCEEANLDLSLHDFRRAFCLSQLRANVDILSVSRMLGHTTTVLVAKYAAQTAADLHQKYKSPCDAWEK